MMIQMADHLLHLFLRLPCYSSIPSPSLPNLSHSPHPSLSLPILSFSPQNPHLLLRRRRRLHPILSSSAAAADAAVLTTTGTPPTEPNSTTRLLAMNIPWSSTVDDIRALFEKYGTVVDVELSMYSKSKNRNRGFAFVEMGSDEEAAAALKALEGSEYEGRTLKLIYARPKKKKEAPAPVLPKPLTFNLFVANLRSKARATDLKEFFASNGARVVSAEVIFHYNPRRSSGYGFVAFATEREADAALTDFQGKELMGRPIRVARSKRFMEVNEGDKTPQSEGISEDLTPQAEEISEDLTPHAQEDLTLNAQEI